MWECKDIKTGNIVAVHREKWRSMQLRNLMEYHELYTLNLTKKNYLDLLDILL